MWFLLVGVRVVVASLLADRRGVKVRFGDRPSRRYSGGGAGAPAYRRAKSVGSIDTSSGPGFA
jgi:hypothetical protein